jgi:threonine dehydratase
LEFIKKEGKEFVDLHQVGNDYEQCVKAAKKYALEKNVKFIHPFENYSILAGYATVAKEMFEQQK